MDNELDELLDSALDDFDKNKEELKNPPIIEKKSEIKDETQSSNVTIEKTNLNVEASLENSSSEFGASIEEDMKLFEEIFSGEQNKDTLKQFTDAIKMFKSDEPSMFKEFEKMMETMAPMAASANKDLNLYEDDVDDDDDREHAKAKASAAQANSQQKPLDKVLSDITKQSEKLLKNTNDGGLLNEEFLLSQLNLDDGDVNESDPASSLLMQPLISMLFSKEILYPSLKMMLENYDKYLETNKEKLNETDLKKYCEQKDCIIQMCGIYEEAKESDSQEVKSSQQQKILELLEKCGNPPAELVPEMNPFAGMGANAMKDACPIS